ncbi:MAG: TetR/AcrR family transcriptional regulator [Nitrospiraceae bacterium]|nr:TetR/AcrR family transcriptional regulator [Nitrospiraceae bacterium]
MRTLILDTAMRLFLEEGFEKVTVRRIAGAIEYSPATIYLYFRDKNDILFALHAEGFDRFYRLQQTVLQVKDPWERLRMHARVYISFALENREYYDLMFIMRGPVEKLKAARDWSVGIRSYDFLKENIRDCMAAGYLPKTEVDVAAFAIWSFTHGMASLIIRQRCAMISPDLLSSVVDGAIDFMTARIEKGKMIGKGRRK